MTKVIYPKSNYRTKERQFSESTRNRYTVSVTGSVYSINKTDHSVFKLKPINRGVPSVKVNGRFIPIFQIMVLTFYGEMLRNFGVSSYKVYFKNGNTQDVRINNLILVVSI